MCVTSSSECSLPTYMLSGYSGTSNETLFLNVFSTLGIASSLSMEAPLEVSLSCFSGYEGTISLIFLSLLSWGLRIPADPVLLLTTLAVYLVSTYLCFFADSDFLVFRANLFLCCLKSKSFSPNMSLDCALASLIDLFLRYALAFLTECTLLWRSSSC